MSPCYCITTSYNTKALYSKIVCSSLQELLILFDLPITFSLVHMGRQFSIIVESSTVGVNDLL